MFRNLFKKKKQESRWGFIDVRGNMPAQVEEDLFIQGTAAIGRKVPDDHVCNGWTRKDLNDLDEKVDALMRYLNVEMVKEEVNDGTCWANSVRSFIRKKKKKK